MTDLRTITTDDYAKLSPPSSFGKPARLEWLAIRQLVIDADYQREITLVGRKNVRKIAEDFNWSMFAPVIVASAGSNTFAIVDGQHRTTAAALCGIEKVPCAIIEAKPGQQAAAFKAINGNTTKLHPLAIFHASVTAGDAESRKVVEVAGRAGVTIVRSPTAANLMKPGQTMAAKTIAKAINQFGEQAVVNGLTCIVKSGDGNAGMLNKVIVWGSIEVVTDHLEWQAMMPKLIDAFDTVDLDDLDRMARSQAARLKGTSMVDQFEGLLVAALTEAMPKRSAA